MRPRIIYRNSRLRTRLVIITVLIMVLPLAVIAPIIQNQIRRTVTDMIVETKALNVSQIADNLSLTLSKLRSVSNLFAIDAELSAALNRAAASRNGDDAGISQVFEKFNIAVPTISFKTVVIAANDHAYGNAVHIDMLSLPAIQGSDWYSRLKQYPYDIAWTRDQHLDTIFSTPELPYVYLIRNIYDQNSLNPLGILITGFSENNLLFTYSSSAETYENIYIMNANGSVISSVNNLALPSGYEIPWERIYSYEKGQISDTISGSDYMLHFTSLRSPFWKVVLLTSMKIPLSRANDVQEFFQLLILIYIVIVLIASYFVANAFLRPIHELSGSMAKIKQGDFDVNVRIRSKDEMADLSESFNDMARKIKTLLDDVVKDQESKRRMELTALQTQVNPHFIYNTLASIRFRVSIDDKKSADRIILALTKLLKNTLSDLDEFITVEKELDILKSYIEIQQMACDVPFESRIQVDPDIRDCLLPKLILQPIVENAILHGIKPKKQGGVLRIEGQRRENMIEFSIYDNGVGFDKSQVALERSDVDFGIGIRNVEGRLSLHFGRNYRFEITSEKEKGTKVTVGMPYTVKGKGIIQYEYIDN